MKIIARLLANIRKRNPIAYRENVVTLKVMSPLVLILLLALYFHEFVMMAIEKDIAISGTIICVCLYGVLIILQKLISAQKDFRIIERFGKEAQAGVSMKQLLEEPWIRDRYVRHYLKHIAQTGGTLSSQLDQNAIESELHALQEDYNSKLEFPQFLVGFMIAMGLLGTFIGLLETLTGISEMLGGMSNSTASPEEQFKGLVSELRKPLAGMGIAFSASMFGLVASLMLSIMMTNLRHFISRVVMCARNVMHDLTEITRKTQPNQYSSTVTTQNANGGENTRKNDSDENGVSSRPRAGDTLLASRMDSLLKKLEVLFKSFEASINGTTRLNELLGFGPRMKETGENTLEELRSVAASAIEQQRIMQQMADSQILLVNTITSILEAQRRSQTELASSFRTITEHLGSVDQSTAGATRNLWEIKEIFTGLDMLHSAIDSMSSNIKRQTGLFEDLISEERSVKDLMSVILDTQRRSQTEVAASFRVIGDRAGSIEKANIGSGKHLYEIKENLTNFTALYSMIESISSGIGHQTILLEEIVTEARSGRSSAATDDTYSEDTYNEDGGDEGKN